MKCRSGKHEWTDPEDAARCCDPRWRRDLRVGVDHVGPWFAHVWTRVEDEDQGEREGGAT